MNTDKPTTYYNIALVALLLAAIVFNFFLPGSATWLYVNIAIVLFTFVMAYIGLRIYNSSVKKGGAMLMLCLCTAIICLTIYPYLFG